MGAGEPAGARGQMPRGDPGVAFLSGKTVANNVSNILAKLQLAQRAEAIVAAREAGLGRGGDGPGSGRR